MQHRRLMVGLTGLALLGGGTGAALAAGGSAPRRANIVAVQTVKVKINRFVQDGLRWKKDTYTIRSGGTLHVVNNAPSEGPHTLTIVKKRDLPRTAKGVQNCKICKTLGEAHGADPNGNAPPKFLFLENGVGSTTAPNLDKPGDSAVTGDKKGDSVNLKVTAKKGATLYIMCIIHAQMQAKVVVR